MLYGLKNLLYDIRTPPQYFKINRINDIGFLKTNATRFIS
jgi:hypothetical protein